MKKIYKSFAILIVLISLLINISGCFDLQSFIINRKKELTPSELYYKAWDIINDNYFDRDYNGEDWNYWKHKYDNRLKTNDDAYVAIQTMLESLNDRYTRFLKPEKFSEQDTDIAARIYGIGIQIAEKDNSIMIVSVLDDTPAFKAKLKGKDKIIAVDDKSTKGMSLKDVANLIRGEIGTYVKLTIERGKAVQNYNVQRDEIKIKSVETEKFNNNITYIRLSSFISKNADIEMEEAIINARNSDAVILDIRNNYGGLLPNAISIANIFLDKGSIIVSIIDKEGNKKNFHAVVKSLTDKPLVVLINSASASASEILSGALKDHHRAILVGEKTYGKGMVQKIFNLPDGSGLNVTVSKYLTPNGTDINKVGITPDIEINLTYDDLVRGDDVQLEEAKKVALQAIKESNNKDIN